MDQADLPGALGVHALRRLEIARCLARADGADHIGGDGGGNDAEADLRGGEHRTGRGHAQIAGRRQSQAAAESRAMYPCDGRLAQFGEGAQHGRQPAGVFDVVRDRCLTGCFHPIQIGAGGEAFAATRQNHHPYRVVGVECAAGGGKIGDQLGIEGVVQLGAVHPQGGDRSGILDFKRGVHESHPEQAESGRWNGRIEGGRQR